MKSNTYKQAKEELKQLAAQIKTGKPAYRGAQSAYSKLTTELGLNNLSWYERWTKSKNIKEYQEAGDQIYKHAAPLGKAQYEFRHKHIAYCLLRGTPIEKIETLPKDGTRTNPPDMKYVETLLASLKAKVTEEEEAFKCASCMLS